MSAPAASVADPSIARHLDAQAKGIPHHRLANAKSSIQYLLDPKTGPQPTQLRTRAFLRTFRYLAVFIFWRVVRYAKYAAVGAIVAAVSGTVIGSVASGAAFVLAPPGILGGAGVGLVWAVAKFGWRRARARVRHGERGEAGADPRRDERIEAEGAEREMRGLRADPW